VLKGGTPIPAWIYLREIATSMLRGGKDPIGAIMAAYDTKSG